MDFKFSKEQQKFRQEVRDFLEEEIRNGTFEPDNLSWNLGYSPAFTKKCAERGWIGITCPKKYGGLERSYVDNFILYEEMFRHGAPVSTHFFADCMLIPILLIGGTESQRKELIPRALRGEITFAVANSEPDAGYDLTEYTTQYVKDGGDYIINGQKIWISFADHADIIAVSAKSASEPKTYSFFLVNKDAPGLTVNSIQFLSGHDAFSEVILENVRLPGDAVIGGEGKFRETIIAVYPTEWGGLMRITAFYPLWKALLKFVKEARRGGKPLSEDPLIRSKLAKIETNYQVGRLFALKVADSMDKGDRITPPSSVMSLEAPLSKVHGGHAEQFLLETAMDIVGAYGQLTNASKLESTLREVTRWYLFSRAFTVRGRPEDVLMTRLAELVLGLPNFLEPDKAPDAASQRATA